MIMLTVYEPLDRFVTVDAHGHAREWRVKSDGLVVIVSSAVFTEPERLEQQTQDQAQQ